MSEPPAPDDGLLPCATCPWRIGKDATTIPCYDHPKARGLVSTEGEGDAFRPVMACHHSGEDAPTACRGYLAQQGESNINVRVLAAMGRIPYPGVVREACRAAGLRLHKNYRAVLRKLSRSVRRGS